MSKSCAACEYNLAGLPDVGTCPECGVQYDPDYVVLRIPIYGRAVWKLLLIAILAVVWMRSWHHGGLTPADSFLALALIAGAIWTCRRLFPRSARYCTLIVNAYGVTIEHPAKDRQALRWSDIQRASTANGSSKLVIEGHHENVLLHCTSGFVGANVAGTCAREINRLMELYCGRDGGRSG